MNRSDDTGAFLNLLLFAVAAIVIYAFVSLFQPTHVDCQSAKIIELESNLGNGDAGPYFRTSVNSDEGKVIVVDVDADDYYTYQVGDDVQLCQRIGNWTREQKSQFIERIER